MRQPQQPVTSSISNPPDAAQRSGCSHQQEVRGLYRTILADPPWAQTTVGRYKNPRHSRADALPYKTMTVPEICALPIATLADAGAHLWLWTTNEYLEEGFEVMRAWGFKYLAPVTWVKPSGLGAWFVHRTQTMLFGYKSPLQMAARYKPTVINANPQRHSAKPSETYELIESVSSEPRVEIFARPWTPLFEKRVGWDVWGNEVKPDVQLHEAL